MKQFKVLATAFAAALLVAACGGGGDGDQTPPVPYKNVVSFGDSLSDAGTYGRKFTVNGVGGAIGATPTPSYTWAQLVAASVTGMPSCAARLGGFGAPETTVANCFDYAQGGARVSNPNGIGNLGGGAGALTEALTTQVSNYLIDVNNGGKFTGNELVTVLAGPNDLLAALDGATATGNHDFPLELAKLLVADISPAVTDLATIGADVTAIATDFGTAIANGGSANDGALAAVQKAATLGSINAFYIMTVAGTALATANANATAGTTAWGNAFVSSLTTQLVVGIPAANQAAAVTAIPTAFSTAYATATTASASATSAQNLGLLAAFQAAADAGSTKVSAVLGTSNHATLGNIGNATVAAHTYAADWVIAQAQAAATDLATQITNMVTVLGAKRVVVLNLPDMSLTPSAQALDAPTQGLILKATQAFNDTLKNDSGFKAGVAANHVLLVDFFTNMQNNVNDPTYYALVADPVTHKALRTPVCGSASSLTCNISNIALPTTGSSDIEHFMFADGANPTPYGHKLLSQVVNKIMIQAGWL